MRLKLFFFISLFFMLQSVDTIAQNQLGDWRVSKKIRTENNGQKFAFEYAYNKEGLIKKVQYFSATGVLTITISDFAFNRNKKPLSYTVTYNRENINASVKLDYDNNNRLTKLTKTLANGDVTTFTYRYSPNTLVVIQQDLNNPTTGKATRLVFYDEKGNYEESSKDAETGIITTVITDKKEGVSTINPHPDNFLGGFTVPDFLGTIAFGNSEPIPTVVKDRNGLITEITLATKSVTRKYDYTYVNVKNNTPEKPPKDTTVITQQQNPITVIKTNITCAGGKKNIENLLKRQDGVRSATIDIKTGALSLNYSSDGTSYNDIIDLINEEGFDADKIKSRNPEKNSCVKQPEQKETPVKLTFQTNITCKAAEAKVLNELRQVNGIVDVKIDIVSGKVDVEYLKSATNVPAILSTINNAGYDVNDRKSATPEKNLCSPIITVKDTLNVTIQTDIKCAEGKQKVEAELKAQNGIITANVDIKTGKVTVVYNQKMIGAAQLNKIINGEGFEADGKASINPEDNPCTKKKEPENTSTIKGRMFYRYHNGKEQPVLNSFSFPLGLVTKKLNNPPYNTTVLVPNDEPFPDYICNGFYGKTSDTRPLKYGNMRLIYTIFESGIENPTSYSDLKGLSGEDIFMYGKATALGNGIPHVDLVVAEVTTDANGNFSSSFINKYKIGFLGKEVTQGTIVKYTFDKYGGKKPESVPDGKPPTTIYRYGVLRLSTGIYYCNSDIIMFPKSGKTMILPDEVVFVKSHNLEIKVRTDEKIKDQALKPGEGVDSYPVKLLAIASTYPSATSGFPIESNIETYTALKTEVLNKPAKVLDLGKTDEKGYFIFKNVVLPDNIIEATEQKIEGNYVYDTKSKIENDDTPDRDLGAQFSSNFSLNRLNSRFGVSTTKKEIIISPKLPEIYLRAITKQGGQTIGIADAVVSVTEYKGFLTFKNDYLTDKNGYFHLKDLPLSTELQGGKTKITGPVRTIEITKKGYAKKIVTSKQQLQFGERFPAIPEQLMVGGGKVIGHIENEKGEPVVCNVRVGNGPFVKTASNGWFEILDCQAGIVVVEVVPTVDNYFPEKLLRSIAQADYTIISNVKGNTSGKILVIEKLHRVQFKFIDENNKVVTQSCTTVGDNLSVCYPSNTNTGITNVISIASPGDEFRVRTVAEGYVTYDDYVNIPISKTATVISITLVKGQMITGIVKDVKTSKPIKNARVYTINGTNEDGEIQNETFTDDNGNYVLKGVIDQSIWMQNLDATFKKPINVYAVKSGDPGYLRSIKSVQGSNGVGTADFDLTPLNAKAEIWGLPIEITSAKQDKKKKIIISGAFVKLAANATFKPTLANLNLPFKDVEVVFEKSKDLDLLGKNTSKEVSIINPVNNSINIEATSFKVTAFNKFGCEVIGTLSENQTEKLTVTNSNGCGNINGFVTSELSSFNFSYNYTGKFLFNSAKFQIGIPQQPMPVLASKDCDVSKPKFDLAPLYNKSNFKIHNFNAEMGGNSYVNNEGFFINADVKLQIPLVGKETMPAGQIKVLSNNIIWDEYTGDINLPLEKWNIVGKGLQYDINQGGFRVTDGNLQTNLPSVPLKDLIIHPTSIDLGKNTFTGKEKLTLGDVTPLILEKGATISLTYDAAAPFDQQPHYRLNISGSTETVAYINKIPGLDVNDKIKINLISAYSDTVHKSIIVKAEDHKFYNVISQKTTGIEVGNKSFTLIGNTDLQIPGANSNVTGRFIFYKDAKDKDKDANGVVCKVQKLQTDIEMQGKVKFNGYNFNLSKDLLVVNGDVIIYKESVTDGFTVHGTVTKTPSSIKMDIKDSALISMERTGNKAMEIQKGGGNYVAGNQWSLVKFTAKPKGYITNGKEILTPGKDLIDFIVNGAMVNDPLSDKKIGVDGINTPFGGIAISFDFDKKILQGSLTLKSANIPIGPIIIQDGIIDMQIDSKGFIMAGAISNAELGIPLLKDFKSGIALGFYDGPLPTFMTNNLLDVTLYKELPDLQKGLKGVYINVMKTLSKSDFPSLPGPTLDDIPGVSAIVPKIDFNGGIDLRTSINLQNGLSVIIGGLAFVNASCLYNLELCDVGLAAGAKAEIELKYNKGLTGEIIFDVYGELIYCMGQKKLGLNLTLEKKEKDFGISVSLK